MSWQLTNITLIRWHSTALLCRVVVDDLSPMAQMF
jgi:hypothetical protein